MAGNACDHTEGLTGAMTQKAGKHHFQAACLLQHKALRCLGQISMKAEGDGGLHVSKGSLRVQEHLPRSVQVPAQAGGSASIHSVNYV